MSGVDGLSDASIAALLPLCPNLRALYAAGSKLGAVTLAVLAGRQQPAAASAGVDAPAQERQPRQHRERQRAPHSSGSATRATEELAGLHLSPGRPQTAGAAAAAGAPQPACPLLERLDVSGCRVKGSGLRRVLRCLPQLADLRLNACSGLGSMLDPLLPGSGSGGDAAPASVPTSGKAVATVTLLGRLTRLEALDADDLSARHVAALLQHCTSLRRLALSGKQLAAERADHAHYSAAAACGVDASSGCEARTLPSLLHLEVGWGSGGTLLQHLVRKQGRQLSSLVVHPGAAVSDDHLHTLAASCRSLGRLSLMCSNVSDAGGCSGPHARCESDMSRCGVLQQGRMSSLRTEPPLCLPQASWLCCKAAGS